MKIVHSAVKVSIEKQAERKKKKLINDEKIKEKGKCVHNKLFRSSSLLFMSFRCDVTSHCLCVCWWDIRVEYV